MINLILAQNGHVLLNAVAAFIAAGLDHSFKEGIERAEASIDCGAELGENST